ncbi:Spo23p NDAI_0F02160 [Naumovozyma dairenensis CBS 421]|uniref:Arrestin-like N-terminal domain-containing protein n=1 Tax=Naumovozyma dairenensis (strain ATCC 10597 / BCRC 20456 / CBS 421 / NBRC 0211 / NRRL Y-12639) TaxID=1071378 RepID=G0WCM3_NAUDC|nr:hypothetical protein NDAI_0F02160 [Naumovozyma dairenensis CBS 421]CCD25534.1 hypothetical protein NDAI_0F02160 [Naumovozyma dairenensis CBS 421]
MSIKSYLPRKEIRLKELNNNGTIIKNDTLEWEYCYDPTQSYANPTIDSNNDTLNGYRSQLLLDPECEKIFISDLLTEAASNSSLYDDPESLHIEVRNNDDSVNSVSLTGKLRIEILKGNSPMILKSCHISLKCYVKEYGCFNYKTTNKKDKWGRVFHNTNEKEDEIVYAKIVKELESEKYYSSKFSVKQLKVIVLDKHERMVLLSKGTYHFPFTFTINPKVFPAGCKTYFGTTCYRLENSLTFLKIRKNQRLQKEVFQFDTQFLTKKILIKRVLAPSCMLQNEPIYSSGKWKDDSIIYNMALFSKMIEIGEPFELFLSISKNTIKYRLKKITVALIQNLSIPNFDGKTKERLEGAYINKTIFKLAGKTIYNDELNENDFFQYTIHNLLIPKKENSASLSIRKKLSLTNIHPFYCEPCFHDPTFTNLKNTHMLSVRLTLQNVFRSDSKGREIWLFLKIPIILVDDEMTSSLKLPPYTPITYMGNRQQPRDDGNSVSTIILDGIESDVPTPPASLFGDTIDLDRKK